MATLMRKQDTAGAGAHGFSIERVRRSLIHFFVGKGVGMLLGFGLLLVLVRALSVEHYGFYVATLALLEIMQQTTSFGLLVAAQRYLPELLAQQEGRRLARLLVWLSLARAITLLAGVGVLYFLTEPLARLMGFDGYAGLIRLYLLVIFFEGFARFLDVVFDSMLMQGASQTSLILRSAMRLGLVLLAFVSLGHEIPLEQWVLIDLSAAVLGCGFGLFSLVRFARRVRQDHPGTDASLEIDRYKAYSLPIYVAATLYTASGVNTVKIIAVRVLQTAEFGAFGFAAAFSAMLQRYLPLFLLIGMIRPLFVAARQRPDFRVRLPILAKLIFKLNVFALAPATAFLYVCGEPLADLITGGKFPQAAGFLLAFLALLLAQALRAIVSMTAQALEEARAPLFGTLLGLCGLPIGVALSMPFGAYGLVIGLALSELLFCGWVAASLMREGLSLKMDWAGLAKILFATLMAMAAASLPGIGQPRGVLALLSCAGLIAATYLVVAYALKPFALAEREMINKILKRKIFVW
ncbi:MAG TPA: oligosaccharide flippase family protein [Thiobacillus sp.]|nr:oligosaccharide flippase family protein [Thiobacillus sp.]